MGVSYAGSTDMRIGSAGISSRVSRAPIFQMGRARVGGRTAYRKYLPYWVWYVTGVPENSIEHLGHNS
jgi:hypothetical protein